MFDSKARQSLQTLQTKLNHWEQSIPPRARRFHDACQRLNRQIQALLTRRLPFRISDDEVESYNQRVAQLDGLADSLAALASQADQLEDRLNHIVQQTANDSELDAWLKTKSKQWSMALARLATNCERQGDLLHDEERLEEIETELGFHTEMLYWLKEAGVILNKLGSNLDTAKLEAELPNVRQHWFEQGASREEVEQLKTLVQQLQKVRPPEKPKELQNVAALLNDLRGWDRVVGAFKTEVGQLVGRHRLVDTEWKSRDQAEVKALMDEAERLRKELTERAQSMRDQKLQTLEELMLDLGQACGPQPQMEDRLNNLKQKTVDRYQSHRDWMAKFDEVNDYFKAIANNHLVALEKRLEELIEELKKGLDELWNRPLSDQIKQQAEKLQDEIRQLSQLQSAEGVLRELRRSNDLKDQMQALVQQAEQDIADLFKTQQTLRERNSILQAEAELISVSLDDLDQAIEELVEGAKDLTLEQARSSAHNLENSLAKLEQQFVDRCQTLLSERIKAVNEAADALRQTERPPSLPSSLPTIHNDADPQQAALSIVNVTELHSQLMAQVQQAVAELDEQRYEVQSELDQIPPDTLGPGDQREAERLAQALQQGAWSEVENELERLQRLSKLLERSNFFLDQLFQEKRSARRRFKRLEERLREFKENQLQLFCPELTDRLEDLTYGVQEQPLQWSDVHEQLDMAEEMFKRIEAQALRLAASDLDWAVGTLRSQMHNPKDPQSTQTAKMLLAELEKQGHDKLPPVILRTRLMLSIPRR